jgi:predicted regulator of Ras-like GTPase activity (Roadblock/LC7/MglB family)
MPAAAAPRAPIPAAPVPKAPAPQAPPAPPAHSAPAPLISDAIAVGLSALAEGWPDAVRQEILQAHLVDSKVALPAEVVERSLKQGRIAFTWKAIRAWLQPTPSASSSANDAAVLELPLKVVAPIFLARQREANKGQQQLVIDENIPNLFFGFPQTEAPGPNSTAAATAKPSDTNYYVWDDSSDTVRVHESEVKRGPTPGTNFVAKYATPNEVVSRAAGLDGVAGALIALPDGLMVASRLSSDLNGDTLAAFLPQIFGKVSQCTKELRMGDLNNLNFTVGNVPWKIFRVNAIFFAAFGKAGEPLPTAQLAALAGELDHKPK